jgi:hypothetical protein
MQWLFLSLEKSSQTCSIGLTWWTAQTSQGHSFCHRDQKLLNMIMGKNKSLQFLLWVSCDFFFFLFERERNIALILGEMSLKILTESKGSWLCPFLSSVPALPLPGTANSWVGGLSLYDCGCGFLSLHFEKHKLPHCRCCSTGGAGGSLTYFTAFADFCGYQNCL